MIKIRQEAKWEREGGWDWERSSSGIGKGTRDACNGVICLRTCPLSYQHRHYTSILNYALHFVFLCFMVEYLENVLVIFCQEIILFFSLFLFYSVCVNIWVTFHPNIKGENNSLYFALRK